MNCRDVTEILDNQKADLDPAQRREAEAHVATCAECASGWHLQAGLSDLPDMALPANFSSHCRLLVAATPPSVPARRAINRRVLVGALTALAAAAALLLILPRQSAVTLRTARTPPAAVGDATAEAAPAIPEAAPAQLAEQPPPTAIEASTTSHFLVRVMRPGSEANNGSPTSTLPAALTEQMRAIQNEPSRKQAIDSLRDALIEELRTVPGLMLVESDLTMLEPSSSRKYQLRVGGVTGVDPNGKPMQGSSRFVSVMLDAEQIRSNGKSVRRLMHSASVDLQAPCTGAAPVADTPCQDPRGTAAAMVRKLREEVFPPAPPAIRALQAKLQDVSLDAAQRSKLLFDLLKIQDNTDDLSMLRHPGVVRAVIDLAAGAGPTLRARIWRAMRGIGSRDLIQPLTDSLVNDPPEVRLAALETLSDFRDDARVRSTLESVALGDSQPLVRAVAERGLSGEGPWKQYVVASLKDSSRPAAERTEALTYYLYPPGPGERAPSHPDYRQLMEELLDDDAATALAQALPTAGSLNGSANNLLGNFAPRHRQNAAVTEMLLTIVESDTRPVMRSVAGEVLARMHANEPRVRAVLNKVIQSDPDQSVRKYIQERMPPGAQ